MNAAPVVHPTVCVARDCADDASFLFRFFPAILRPWWVRVLIVSLVAASLMPTDAGATTVTFTSVGGTEDGRILEDTETSDTGHEVMTGQTDGIHLGDATQDRQWKGFVSFDTSSLPDGATIVSATLRLRRASLKNTNPFTWGGDCQVDIKNGTFGAAALESTDFQATASATNVAQMSNPANNGDWSEGTLNSSGLAQINKSGKTQLRVYFAIDDNDDGIADKMLFNSGSASAGSQPELVVEYSDSPPAAPSDLSATAISSSEINLAWTDNSSDETGFKVERKTGAGGTYGQIDTTGANATTYGDTGLAASAEYYYKVRATNASGDSAYSNEANATTQTETFDGLVNRFAPNVVSYWKFQNDGTDEQGTQTATITGSPELNVPTIVDLDTIAEGASADGEVIAWSGGTGQYADAAHNAAHKTAAGTIVVTFQCDTLDEKSILVGADSNMAAGGLSVEVQTDGAPRAFLKDASGSAVVLTGQAGDVQLSQAYTQVFKWGTGGLSLALYNDAGTLVRRVTNALTDGVTGTSTIRFGAWHSDVAHHDGPYGRVVWLNRRITDTEEADLARAKTITRGDDTTAPSVSVTSPEDEATVSGSIAVTADASDNVGVVGVQFKLDGVNLGAEDTVSPYSISWDTTTASDGGHVLTAVARDAADNTTTSTDVGVTVDNSAPAVSVTAPSAGSSVLGSIVVTADASDNEGVVGVQFKLDGADLGAEATTTPYSVNWDTATASNGSHSLTAVARDAAGNTTTSTAVDVTVDNEAPSVSITDPADQATVSGTISVTASASDNDGVVAVQFKLDGADLGAEDTSSPYSITWDTTAASDGAHALTAVARDAAGNTATSTTVNVSVDNDGGGSTTFVTFTSVGGTEDGRVLESTETSNVGSSVNSGQTDGIHLGDATQDRQWKGFASFDTSSLPDGATIVSAKLRLRRSSLTNTSPFTWGGDCQVDIKNGTFGVADVEATDFEATASANNVAQMSNPANDGDWSEGVLNSTGLAQINTTGRTQLRVYFAIDDNDDGIADKMLFNSGSAATGSQPELVVEYSTDGGDTTAPTVSITEPLDQATVSGTSVTVSASASDDVGVAGVQFKLDGANLGSEDTTSPYSINWDTTTVSDGGHALTAVARDAAGNSTTSATVNVTVDNGGGTLTYDDLVAGFAPDVVSYWKFQNNGTDEQGTQNATITGSPELNVPTIVDLDTIAEGASADGEVLAWSGGTGQYAEAAHHAAHKTAAGTIVVTFQSDGLAEKSVLVAADSNTAAGGLSVEVNTDGSPRAFLKDATGNALVLSGQAGDVQLDQAYTQIFKWGTGGLSLALYDDAGTLVRRVTNALTDGVTGTSTIRFGAWHTDVAHHDGPYGRVVWLNRRITDAEEADLARAKTISHGTGAPNAPSGLGATTVSSSRIDLSWTDNSSNETGFKIERKTGAGGTFSQIDTVGADVTSYASTGLSAGTTYYYRVRATNTSGNSAYSNEANATTQAGSGTGGITIPEFAYQTITDSVPNSNVCWWNPTSGNDTNDGSTKTLAKKTFGAAQNAIGSGGTVVVAGGTHVVPELVFTKSGSSGNRLKLFAEPSQEVILIHQANADLDGARKKTLTWTLVDSTRQIWEANPGISDGQTIVNNSDGRGQVTDGLAGFIRIPNGAHGRPHLQRLFWYDLNGNYVANAFHASATGTNAGQFIKNGGYGGPGVYSVGNGRIRIRMQDVGAAYSGDDWPTDGRMGDLVNGSGLWRATDGKDPNDFEIHLTRFTGDFGVSGPTLLNLNGHSWWHIKGINGALMNKAVDLPNGSSNNWFEKCTWYAQWSGVDFGDNTQNTRLTRCMLLSADNRHYSWREHKTSNYWWQHGRSVLLRSGTTSTTALQGLILEHCTTFGWFDLSLSTINSGRVNLNYCAFLNTGDDGFMQRRTDGTWAYDAYRCYFAGGPPWSAETNNGIGSNDFYWRFCVIDIRIPMLWTPLGETGKKKGVQPNGMYPIHSGGTSGPVICRKMWNCTIIHSPDSTGSTHFVQGTSPANHDLPSGRVHEVYNNIWALIDNQRYLDGFRSDYVMFRLSCDRSQAGVQRYDYNCYFRDVPEPFVDSFAKQIQDARSVNRNDYSSLSGFRSSSQKTTSEGMYNSASGAFSGSNGTNGHEAHGVQVDPGFVNLANRDYRPTHASVTSGALDLSTSGWPNATDPHNWKGALDPNGDGSEVGPQPE